MDISLTTHRHEHKAKHVHGPGCKHHHAHEKEQVHGAECQHQHHHVHETEHRHEQLPEEPHPDLNLASAPLDKLLNYIKNNKKIPKPFKPNLNRFLINLINISIAQGLSLPLRSIHSPREISAISTVGVLHLLSHGLNRGRDFIQNTISILPFISINRIFKVPSFVLRSLMGLTLSISNELSINKGENKLDNIKKIFSKNTPNFLYKLSQMEAMLNIAVPLSIKASKNSPNHFNKTLIEIFSMSALFTAIPKLMETCKPLFKIQESKKNETPMNMQLAALDELACPICDEVHGVIDGHPELLESTASVSASHLSKDLHTHAAI